MKNKIIYIMLLVLLLPSALALQGSVFQNDALQPYYVHADNEAMRGLVEVRNDFGKVFSADLTQRQAQLFNKLGVRLEPVSTYTILETTSCRNDKDCSEGEYCDKSNAVRGMGVCMPSNGDEEPPVEEPISDRTCNPTTQTPWGIQRVYDDNTLTTTVGGEGIRVAVLDTGVMQSHLDLQNRIVECETKVTRFNPDTRSCEDGHGHGTHVAGTVLADAGSDGKGIYGVAPDADLIVIKVCDRRGSCYGDDIAAGIKRAVELEANIISLSLGGSSLSSMEQAAIDYAVENGVLVIASAGNSGPNLDTIGYPAAYHKVVAVAATDINDRVADFSSRGVDDTEFKYENRYLEVAAPGVGVESAYTDGCYRTWSGTSMAAPHVSGLAAKLWQGDAVTTRTFLQESAQDITLGHHAATGYDPASGFGLPTVV